MQTIKTAAIVVLLMTVIYGAYISLTTPPEPLPADVEDMLVMTDEAGLPIESTLPPSLAELGISEGAELGSPEISQSAHPNMFASQPSPDSGIPQTASTFDTASGLPKMSSGTNAELASAAINTTSSFSADVKSQPGVGFQTTFTDSTGLTPSSNTTGATAGYQSTNQTFQLPDPASLNNLQEIGNSTTQPVAISTADSSTATVSQTNAVTPSKPNLGLANAIRTADRQYGADQRREALSTLSIFYSAPDLTIDQRRELLSRLDPLAAEVVYSPEHLLERPYRVARNETLMEIADRYEVPWQLLANINQVTDPVTIIPGTELKVVRGPFRAEVNLATRELTLFLGDLYAGRFPVGIGNDPAPRAGTFTVQDKQTSKTFYDPSGAPVAPGNPRNPYGQAWIDLGGQICIHGSPSTTEPTDRGCISLAADFADDLYGILSQGSTVTIR